MSCGCPNPAIHWSSDFNCRTCQNCGVLMVQEDGTPLPEEDRLPKPENMHGYCDQFGGEDFPSDPAELNAEIDRQKGIVKTDQNTFVHLRVHTHCSFLKATCKPDDIIKKAKENGQPAIAKTEFGNMCGAPTFVKKCLDEGIKPIIGTEFDVKYGLDANTENFVYPATFIALNRDGYKSLIEIYLGHYHIDWRCRCRIAGAGSRFRAGEVNED